MPYLTVQVLIGSIGGGNVLRQYNPVTYNKPVLHIIVNNKSYRNPDHEVIHAVI